MSFIGKGGKRNGMPMASQEEVKTMLASKEDLLSEVLTKAIKDYPILICNLEPKEVMNRALASVIDILASVVAQPFPGEPEVLPRNLGFSAFTITEPRTIGEWNILDEVDRAIGGEFKIFFPNLKLKAFPREEEARRVAFFGRGNQNTLTNLSGQFRTIFAPGLFAECMAFVGDTDQAEYFLLVEVAGEELVQAKLLNEDSIPKLAQHFAREDDLFFDRRVQTPTAKKLDIYGRRVA